LWGQHRPSAWRGDGYTEEEEEEKEKEEEEDEEEEEEKKTTTTEECLTQQNRWNAEQRETLRKKTPEKGSAGLM